MYMIAHTVLAWDLISPYQWLAQPWSIIQLHIDIHYDKLADARGQH